MLTADNMVARVRVSYDYTFGALNPTSFQAGQSLAGTNVYLGGSYTHASTQLVQQRRTRVEIDLNVRVRGNDTFVSFEDVSGPIAVGESVEVYESESGVSGEGKVTEIDGDRELVYLSVDWSSLREDGSPSAYGDESAFSSSSYQEVSPAGTAGRLLFIGALTANTSLSQGSWIGMIPRPSLADIRGSDRSMWITAPTYDWCGLLPNTSPEPYVEMRQNVFLSNSTVVAA